MPIQDPVLFRWSTHIVYWYSALLWLAIVLAIAYAQWRGRRLGYRHTQVLDGALWALVGGLLGARLAYVIPNWQDYGGRPSALLGLWGGGYTFQGGLLGGALGLWLYSLLVRLSFPRLADLAAPAVALAQALGWAGAWVHGANYGLVLSSPLSMWLPDLYGVYGPRFPTQMLACALGILLFLGLHRLSKFHLQPGLLALVYLVGNGLGHFLLEFTRADEAPYWGPLRWTQVAALAEVSLGVVLWFCLWRRHHTRTREGTQ